MKKTLTPLASPCLLAALLFASFLFPSCGNSQNTKIDTEKAPVTQLKSIRDSLSWGYGQQLALTILNTEFFDTAFNKDLVLEAFAYTLQGGKQNLLEDEMAGDIAQFAVMQNYSIMQHKAKLYVTQVDSLQRVYFANLEKNNPNVKRCQLGDFAFYYEVLTPGKGPNAGLAERIRFDYRSFNLLTGAPIDQTYGNREPIVHVVGSPMFPGLIEAFQKMNAGSIYRFYFPHQLAFGAEGSGDVIPPYTPVIYEIELHEIYKD